MFVDLSHPWRESVAFQCSDICIKVLCVFYCRSLCCNFDSSLSRQENINHRITGFNSHWSQAGVHAAASLQSWHFFKQSESVGIISLCVAVLCSMTKSNQGQTVVLHIYHFQFLVSACKQKSIALIYCPDQQPAVFNSQFFWQAKKTSLMLHIIPGRTSSAMLIVTR